MINKLQLILEKNQLIKNIVKTIYVSTVGRYKKYKNNKNFLEHGEKLFKKWMKSLRN